MKQGEIHDIFRIALAGLTGFGVAVALAVYALRYFYTHPSGVWQKFSVTELLITGGVISATTTGMYLVYRYNWHKEKER